jgi:hypothetical protein
VPWQSRRLYMDTTPNAVIYEEIPDAAPDTLYGKCVSGFQTSACLNTAVMVQTETWSETWSASILSVWNSGRVPQGIFITLGFMAVTLVATIRLIAKHQEQPQQQQ